MWQSCRYHDMDVELMSLRAGRRAVKKGRRTASRTFAVEDP